MRPNTNRQNQQNNNSNGLISSSHYNSIKSMSASERFNGMIKQSSVKTLRNKLFRLFDYISIVAPRMSIVQTIIAFVRIFQFFGPAILCNNIRVWGNGTLNMTTDILSVAFHLFPGFIRDQACFFYLICYYLFFFLFLGLLVSSCYYYSTHAKLPGFLVNIIFFIFSSIGYIAHPIMVMFIGELIGNIIVDEKYRMNYQNYIHIALSLIVLALYIVIYSTVFSVNITFRPDSLMTVISTNQTVINIFVNLITFLTSLSSKLPVIPSSVLNFIAVLLYLLSVYSFSAKGGFVSWFHIKVMTATAVGAALLLLCITIFDLINREADEIVIVLIFAIWIISYIVTTFWFNRNTIKYLRIMDYITENEANFDDFLRNTNSFANCVVTGFRNAHPICISFGIFKCAVKNWPKNLDVWYLFAKFTAIYPEETQQLSYVELGMIQNKMNGSYAKHVMQQIEAIVRQREQNLIPELKSKIDKLGKHVQACKAKIRYVWDLVLQGNTNELETVIGRAHVAIQQTESEFIHLLGQFPNNRFVARTYNRFVRDVIADHVKSLEWGQKCQQLQRGIQISPDNAHDLGIMAFPQLPKIIEISANNIQVQNITDDTLTQEIDDENSESNATDAELKLSIKENIKNLVIPAYRNSRIARILSLVILFIVPMLVLTAVMPVFIEDMAGSIDYLYTLTKIRSVLFQGMGAMLHYLGENMNVSYPSNHLLFPNMKLFPFPTYDDAIKPLLTIKESAGASWGNTFDSWGQLNKFTSVLSTLLTSISSMKAYKVGNKAMDQVREKIFSDVIPFNYISDMGYVDGCWDPMTLNESCFTVSEKKTKMSLTAICSEYINLMHEVISLDQVPWDAFNKRFLSTSLNNLESVSDSITETISLMLAYATNINDNIQKITKIAMYVIIFCLIFWYLLVCTLTVIKINDNKLSIYRCLTSLQKSVVSRVAETFRILRKEEENLSSNNSHTRDEEMNRQEENLLKLFSTTGDSGSGQIVDFITVVMTTLMLIGLHIGLTCFVIFIFQSSGKQLNDSTPHIEHAMASYAFDLASLILALLLPGSVYPSLNFIVYGYSTESLCETIAKWQDRGIEELFLMKYGDSVNNAPSFASLGIDFDTQSVPEECDLHKVPINFHDVYDCISGETIMSYIQITVSRLVNIYQHTDNHIIFAGDDMYLTHIWHIHQSHVFDRYYYPIFTSITKKVVETLYAKIPVMNEIGYIIVIIAVFVEVIFLLVLQVSEKRQKYALSLLLQCPAKTVLSNNHITSVLSGVFSTAHNDTTLRDSDFFDELVENMSDSIIIVKPDGIILSANQATKRIYNIDSESTIVGQNLNTAIGSMFKENPFQEYTTEANENINLSGNGISNEAKKGFEKNVVLLRQEESNGKTTTNEMHIDMQFVVMSEGIFVTSRDITQSVMYDKLIAEEKMKSDSLLAAILPPRLVPRVASGEKNISFAVQSVTIVFMDIVSFTPWCGSLPAGTVMKTLNLLFKEFDSLTNKHLTMTKIKCIGDCYMGAGGIFAEINQPAVHAKDVVEFGLDSIEAILKIDKEINENLRIRVGVNTGGPIVAGVLGTEKPTFEILGPTINMAQQMEHHGVPMKVHISRAVYELIYGGNFKVQERGQIELKNGNAITYLVEGINNV